MVDESINRIMIDGQTSVLASSRHPAKGIRQIGLFKVDSGGKRRLLYCCHRSNGCWNVKKKYREWSLSHTLRDKIDLNQIQDGIMSMMMITFNYDDDYGNCGFDVSCGGARLLIIISVT